LGFDLARNHGDIVASVECHFASKPIFYFSHFARMNIKAS
jgi:hypothetical protein